MKPMLAAKFQDVKAFRFPVLVSPKLDGIRCLIKEGVAVSRKFKPLPNKYLQSRLADCPHGYDGEIMTYTDGSLDSFNTTQSKVMSREGSFDFKFMVFDDFSVPEVPYSTRRPKRVTHPDCEIVKVNRVFDMDELLEKEAEFLNLGYEGLMSRDPKGFYKFGRSTPIQQGLVKVKRFLDSEAVVTGYEELMHNQNEAELNELGYLKRSSAKSGLVPANMLGKLIGQDKGMTVICGTMEGITLEERKRLWKVRESLIGRTFTYKYFPHGMKDRPRHPIFLRWRNPDC